MRCHVLIKTLPITKLDNHALINTASKLMPTGYLSVTAENLVYLDINDDYIHQLFPLLQNDSFYKKTQITLVKI